jgi:leader peptidase (prepilin peptidase)/N-methyltransferase
VSEAIPTVLRLGIVGILGSLIGSFLNVCIYRIPRGQSIVAPRSSCPHCGTPIPAHLNVPVLSWLFLGGQGACCGRSISARYPLVEALGAAAAMVVFLAALIVLFFTDLDLRLLPDAVTLPLVVVGLLLSFVRPSVRPLSAIIAAGGGFVLLLAVALLWSWFRGIEAVGGGDIKMMAMMGAFLAVQGTLVALLVASVLGAAVGCGIAAGYVAARLGPVGARRPDLSRGRLAAALFGRALRRKAVPFGCFLALGGVVSLFWGDSMARWYLGLLTG